jgi:hypothetical protein
LDVAGTGSSSLPQTAAWEAGARQDAGVEQASDACTQLRTPLVLAARTPSVLILLDHSSSMFEFGYWEPVKQRVLEVVTRFEREVRFGLTTYTGERNGMCPAVTVSAELAPNNADALGRAYADLVEPPFKGETPTAAALLQVANLLADDTRPGDKFIVLVTDGDPDFCDDGRTACAQDAVVAAVQSAYARGITTLAFRVGDQVAADHLVDVANAGSGQPVATRSAAGEDCPGFGASYAEASGGARFHDVLGPQSALPTVIASLRSCVFDLQDQAGIDDALDGVAVELDGAEIASEEPDGFRTNSPTELELLGASCERWRTPEVRLSFTRPCR